MVSGSGSAPVLSIVDGDEIEIDVTYAIRESAQKSGRVVPPLPEKKGEESHCLYKMGTHCIYMAISAHMFFCSVSSTAIMYSLY